MDRTKKAIVFAGGGSKGAYQLGAWKALKELGEAFDIATGTSIGAINAAFYVQNDFLEAEKMWHEVTVSDIMANGINFDVSFDSIISQRENLIPLLKTYLNTKSVDNTPFINMIHRYFDTEKFFSSKTDYALMTVNYKGLGPSDLIPVTVKKADMAKNIDTAWKWIAASASCFPVFPPFEIDGVQYIDGGFYDNIPISAAIQLGAEKIVVVDLNTENNHEGYLRHPDVTYIKPSKDLGNFLNFDRNVLERSIKLGYNDTMKAYGKYYGIKYTFLPDENVSSLVAATDTFISILNSMEAEFDFSPYVHYQRVNKLIGTSAILGEYCKKYRPTKTDLFIAALEMLLTALDYDDEKEYNMEELLYHLKTEADRIYPLLEFDTELAFQKVREFVKGISKGKLLEFKKNDENRMMLIFISLIRALQRITIL